MTVPGSQPIGRDLPQLLEADRELLRLRAASELQSPQQLLGEVAAHAVAEDRDLGADVDAGLERRLLLAVLADAAIAGAHADHARAVHQHVLPGKAREEIDAFGFDLRGQPLHELVQRNDVVAVVLQRRRDDREGELRLSAVRK